MLGFLKLKWIFTILFLGVVVVGLYAVYVAAAAGVDIPGVSGWARSEASPPSPEVVAMAAATEQKIDEAVQDKSAFYLELTEEEVTSLLLTRIDPGERVRDVKVELDNGQAKLSAALNGKLGGGVSGIIDVNLVRGQVELSVASLNLGPVPLPGGINEEVEPLINEVMDFNETLRTAGATQIQSIDIADGKVVIVGLQQTGETVAGVTRDAFMDAFQATNPPTPVPPGADVVPPGRTGGEPGAEVYVALGDSLSANVGVGDPREGYVSRFHRYLEGKKGRTLGLIDFGVSGESSISIFDSQLPQALAELNQRKDDGNPNTKVSVLTIDLGANDLLPHVGSSDCLQDPNGTACDTRLQSALANFPDNFREILTKLKNALEPDAEFYVMEIYNPFDFGTGIPLEVRSNEILEQLNASIRQVAGEIGVTAVANPVQFMAGNAGAWTNMLAGDIHPNADGYQALAYSLAEVQGG